MSERLSTEEREALLRDWIKPDPGRAACYDCLLPYGKAGWCDAHIPDDVWAQVSPTGDEGGLLCITCMARRIEALGLNDVPLEIGSGPWDFNSAARLADQAARLAAVEALGEGWVGFEDSHHYGDAVLQALHPDPSEPTTCPTPGCQGDSRYAAPGRHHSADCRYPSEGA